MLKRKWIKHPGLPIGLVSVCLIGAVVMWWQSQQGPIAAVGTLLDRPQYGGIYRRALRNEPVTLDPASISSIYEVMVREQIFDGLVQFDENLNIKPSLAKSWETSQDSLVWTFYLRKGVKFHHGREVVADDVVYSLTRMMDPKNPALFFQRIFGP